MDTKNLPSSEDGDCNSFYYMLKAIKESEREWEMMEEKSDPCQDHTYKTYVSNYNVACCIVRACMVALEQEEV